MEVQEIVPGSLVKSLRHDKYGVTGRYFPASMLHTKAILEQNGLYAHGWGYIIVPTDTSQCLLTLRTASVIHREAAVLETGGLVLAIWDEDVEVLSGPDRTAKKRRGKRHRTRVPA